MGEARIIPIEGDDGRRRAGRGGAAGWSGDARSGSGSGSGAGAAAGDDAGSPDAGWAPRAEPGGGVADALRDLLGAAASAAANVVSGVATGAAEALSHGEWEERLAEAGSFLRRRLAGDYQVDEFGFDQELTDKVLLALARPVYQRYFRVEARGLENVPAEGGALIVANHSGTLPWDAVMTMVALLDEHPQHRQLRMLGADLLFTMPFMGELARKAGATLACAADAERLLRQGELVGVWPEGFKGIGKPFADRYKLQRFGRGGFVSAALRTGTPIIPVSIVGAEEIYPMLADAKLLARMLGLPYFPITPTFPWLGPLGVAPLPSKWVIQFGEPISTEEHGAAAADDPILLFELTDQVRETIQHTLYRILMRRRSVFF